MLQGALQSPRLGAALEHCVVPGNAWDLAKILDLDMLCALGGHERSGEELERLLDSAELESVSRTPQDDWTLFSAQARTPDGWSDSESAVESSRTLLLASTEAVQQVQTMTLSQPG
ncbi:MULTISPECIES: hypothetical protein [unclassified Streptomyces]|uniref:hypothetical protein n=1 Tax=unclassified Streptomyces TaxID=2593676 RepID=UPI002DD815D3|nr:MULTISPECIES: hypothetical protein [unclassified Streptomyces]WSA90404.1 hypothetical protein OIE63_01795 [Streptomyces sp. NBC_01795]WSB74631.1 hypothetical protein OHB04_01795 [Streptomyces sp. NBC_01775]WSS45729.1 hypothetical protein OG220_37860 [Streptomyces sp. NBC_01187]